MSLETSKKHLSQWNRDKDVFLLGHPVGGVGPFGVNPQVKVYLDQSLKKYDIIYPCCGSNNSAIKVSIPELEQLSECEKWVDVIRTE